MTDNMEARITAALAKADNDPWHLLKQAISGLSSAATLAQRATGRTNVELARQELRPLMVRARKQLDEIDRLLEGEL